MLCTNLHRPRLYHLERARANARKSTNGEDGTWTSHGPLYARFVSEKRAHAIFQVKVNSLLTSAAWQSFRSTAPYAIFMNRDLFWYETIARLKIQNLSQVQVRLHVKMPAEQKHGISNVEIFENFAKETAKTCSPFFGKPRRPLRDFLSWCLSFAAFTNNDSSPFCAPLIPFFRLAWTASTTCFSFFGGTSLTSSTAEVDLLRTRIFFVDAVGNVVAGKEEGELAISPFQSERKEV